MKAKGKPIPPLRSDAAAERFVATADLTDYDLTGFKPVRFEMTRQAPSPRPPITGLRRQDGRDFPGKKAHAL